MPIVQLSMKILTYMCHREKYKKKVTIVFLQICNMNFSTKAIAVIYLYVFMLEYIEKFRQMVQSSRLELQMFYHISMLKTFLNEALLHRIETLNKEYLFCAIPLRYENSRAY